MDLEETARKLYQEDRSRDHITRTLMSSGLSREFAEALFLEIQNSEILEGMDEEMKDLIRYHPTGLQAGNSGLGSRGEGDFIIHHAIGSISRYQHSEKIGCDVRSVDWSNTNTAPGSVQSNFPDRDDLFIGPEHQDDGGVVRISDENYLVVSVDGLHSRLGHFPFLAGFHVARACLRDVLVMGAEPVAMFSDVHLGNTGDPAIILDYTAGISTVSELTGVPLVAGSTLRIAGDLVTGDRLSGAAGAVGLAHKITPRKGICPGDVLIMTSGSGGGTIAAAAIFNGRGEVIRETLNLDFIKITRTLLNDPLSEMIHAMTDVTNGGIRGDAHEIARNGQVNVLLYPETILELVNPAVREMLISLDIDPLGVSIGSLLISCDPKNAVPLITFFTENGIKSDIIGRIEEPEFLVPGSGDGTKTGKLYFIEKVKVERNENDQNDGEVGNSTAGQGIENDESQEKIEKDPGECEKEKSRGVKEIRKEVELDFRESPYTPVKVVADREKIEPAVVRERISAAMDRSLAKRSRFVSWLQE